VRALDDAAFRAHLSGSMPTGGTTLILHVFTSTHLFTANVGDCKAVLSSRGAPEALSEAHNPPVGSERARFEAAGVPCSADHIGGSDINVCRTLGDYDLGAPLKWRAAGGAAPLGPLIPDPEISVRALDALDEFVVTASDGLWDYYSPESSVVTEARRALRANANDAQACAEWLVTQALVRQRGILHAGTQGDNVTVMLMQLRPLPSIPRSSASRLNLRRAASEDSGPAAAGAGLSSPPLTQ
jgi:protein phosphatase 2C family protein 2/3